MIDSAAIKEAWVKCYLKEGLEDPHQQFAELLGIPRQEAKQLCYRFMYRFPILKNMMDAEDLPEIIGYLYD